MLMPILRPVAILVLWSLLMFLWGAIARGGDPAARRLGFDGLKRPGAMAAEMDPRSQNKIDNYNHLMEQPTIFYAIVLAIAVSDAASGYSVALAWLYTGTRIAHSLVQATINEVRVRLPLFLAGTVILFLLGIDALARSF